MSFLHSAGLNTLVEIHYRAHTKTEVRVVAAERVTRRPLELTGLDTELKVRPTLADALHH
ncbi:STAS domain-containing protein [Amycolatopsis minnesotensis]|uniref:STAS domain-containing protein n=1 Tax=Amycolatopsis minnesotensis TaxID=337894 RepID=UPI003CD07A94